jgi:hypothetical protein
MLNLFQHLYIVIQEILKRVQNNKSSGMVIKIDLLKFLLYWHAEFISASQ